jgi:hypothetical protein
MFFHLLLLLFPFGSPNLHNRYPENKKGGAQHERRPCLNFQLVTVAAISTVAAAATAATFASTAAATAVTTTAAAAATSATAVTTAAAAGTFFTRAGDIDGKRAIVELCAIERFNGLLRFFLGGHGHETEAARASSHAIRHEVGFEDRAVLGEGVLKLVFRDVEGKISNKQLIIHSVMSEGRYRNRNCSSKLFPTAGFQIITEACSIEDSP